MPTIVVEQKPGEWTTKEATKEELQWLLDHNPPSLRYVDTNGVIHFLHPIRPMDEDQDTELPL